MSSRFLLLCLQHFFLLDYSLHSILFTPLYQSAIDIVRADLRRSCKWQHISSFSAFATMQLRHLNISFCFIFGQRHLPVSIQTSFAAYFTRIFMPLISRRVFFFIYRYLHGQLNKKLTSPLTRYFLASELYLTIRESSEAARLIYRQMASHNEFAHDLRHRAYRSIYNITLIYMIDCQH